MGKHFPGYVDNLKPASSLIELLCEQILQFGNSSTDADCVSIKATSF